MKRFSYLLSALTLFTFVTSAGAAINLDRTRVIFNSDDTSVSISLNNESKKQPYLAQSWIENANGEKDNTTLVVLPPLQRIEAGEKNQIRITKTTKALDLPQDRETLFYFNVREIPPKSQLKNVMQVAIQSRVKLFYRPAALNSEGREPWQEKVTVTKSSDSLTLNNPTPYYITILSLANAGKNIEEINGEMLPPFSSKTVILKGQHPSHLFTMTYINDFGGVIPMRFECLNQQCQIIKQKAVNS